MGIAALVGGCGGSVPHPAAPPEPPPPAAAAVAATGAPAAAAELSPAGVPEATVSVIRLASPGRDLPVITRLMPPLPGPMANLLRLSPNELAGVFLGPALGQAVDLDQGVDFAFGEVVGDAVPFAASLAIADLDRARSELSRTIDFVEEANGVTVLRPKPGSSLGLLKGDATCVIHPAAGSAPYRLVCGPSRRLVDTWAAYLARTIARAPSPATIHWEVPGEAWRRVLAQKLEPTPSTAADPGEKAGEAFGEEAVYALARDIQGASLALSLEPTAVALGFDLGLRTAESPASVWLRGTDPAAPLPEAFWRLPDSADVALFASGAPPEAMRAKGAAFWRKAIPLIDEDEELTAEQREAFVKAFGEVVMSGGPILYAHGLDRGRARDVLRRFVRKEGGHATAAEAVSAVSGWTMIEVGDDPAKWRDAIRTLLRIDREVGRAKPAAPAKGGGAGAAAAAEKKKKREESHRTVSSLREVPVGAAERLPADTIHLEITSRPNPRYKPEPDEKEDKPRTSDPKGGRTGVPLARRPIGGTTHVFVAPDGSRTWFVIAADAELARARLRDVLLPASPASLAHRADVVSLKQHAGTGGGFVTIGGLSALTLGDESPEDLEKSLATLDRLDVLPTAGKAPLLVTTASKPGQGDERTVQIVVRVPPTGVAELGALFPLARSGP